MLFDGSKTIVVPAVRNCETVKLRTFKSARDACASASAYVPPPLVVSSAIVAASVADKITARPSRPKFSFDAARTFAAPLMIARMRGSVLRACVSTLAVLRSPVRCWPVPSPMSTSCSTSARIS